MQIDEKVFFKRILFIVAIAGFFYLYNFYSPSEKKLVTVSSEAKMMLNACKDEEVFIFDDCLKRTFEQLSTEKPFQTTLKLYRAVQDIDPERVECHQLAHAISRVYVDNNLAGWKDFLAMAPPDCNFGFYHGTIEAFGRHNPNFSLTPLLIRDVCDRIKQKPYETSKGSCVHAFGHMTLVTTKGNVRQAFDFCDELFGFFLKECFHGVFMESLTQFNLADAGLANINGIAIRDRFKLDELEILCGKLSGKQQDLCWREISHAFLFKTNYDAQKTFTDCAHIPALREIQSDCVLHGLSAYIAQKRETPSLADVCFLDTIVSNFSEQCYKMLIPGVLYTQSTLDPVAMKICEHAPKRLKPVCYKAIAHVLTRLEIPQDERQTYCAQATDDYRELCLNG